MHILHFYKYKLTLLPVTVDIIITEVDIFCLFYFVVCLCFLLMFSNDLDHNLEFAQYLEFDIYGCNQMQTLNIVHTPNYDLDH